jgi:hypothetical protein
VLQNPWYVASGVSGGVARARCGRTRRSVGAAVIAVALAAAVLAFASASDSSTEDAASQLPTVAEPIVGNAIKIPAVLFESGAPGSDSLVTPAQAREIAVEMWNLWEAAELAADTRALTQLGSPGHMLTGIINACVTGGRCSYEKRARSPKDLQTVVPLQRSYPIYFLSEVRTTSWETPANGLGSEEPWVAIQILTRASANAQWKVSLVTGYDRANGGVPDFLPSQNTEQNAEGAIYNEPVTKTQGVPRAQFLSRLAGLWQHYKVTGRPPAHNAFVQDGYTTGAGQQFATSRQGSVYLGHRLNFNFSADIGAGEWEFTVGDGCPMECGSIVDHVTSTPLSGLLNQNDDESNWGAPLAPGEYHQISSATDRETCIYPAEGGLDAVGDLAYQWAVTGKKARYGVIVENLETQFGVLADQLQQYLKQLEQCKQGQDACTAAFATSAAPEFAKFSNALITDRFPPTAGADATKLSATARKLNLLMGHLQTAPTDKATLTAFAKDEVLLSGQYKTLVNALSKA